MRSFQIIFLLLFFGYFLLTAMGSYQNLKQILKIKFYTPVRYLFWLFHTAILCGLIFLYIYPYQPREAAHYPVYFYFNILLLTVVVFNLPMSVSFFLHIAAGRKKKSPVIPFAGFIIALGLTVGMIYGTVAGSRQLKIEHIELHFNNLPHSFDGYCIVQLSDAHFGGLLKPAKLLEKANAEINRINPDMLLFTGDLVNNFAREMDGLEYILSSLTSNRESYAILGNHDYGDYTNWESEEAKQANFNAIVNSIHKSGFRLLNNEYAIVKKASDSLFLAGVENWGHSPFPQYADLDAALQGIPAGAFTILMTHDPAHWESHVAGKKDINLTLSGHTHGLQWGIKLAGVPFSPAWFTRKNWGGLYKNGESVLYVNTGLGTVGMPWRIDMPAEITVFTLKRGKVD